MKHTLTLLVFLCYCIFAQAQKTLKTQFLVIGSTAAGIGAGIQAAKAGIKTIIIDSTMALGTDLDKIDTTFTLGLDGRYFKELKAGTTRQEILKQWLKGKELKVLTGVRVISADKVNDGWVLNLSNGQRISAGWVFEDEGPQLVEYRPGKFILSYDIANTTGNWPGLQYRTQVGTPRGGNMFNAYPLTRFVKTKKENWIVIPAVGVNFSIGQIVGAMVANTLGNSPKGFEVRGVQKILLNEGLHFDSYNDMKLDDPHFMVFQRICATGLLRPYQLSPGGTKFLPENKVDIKKLIYAFADYYPNSMAWFEKHPIGIMTVAEALELLYDISHKSFNEQIQLEWNGKLQFTSTFNAERPITRREFAVLMDTYLKPFDVKVDMKGLLVGKSKPLLKHKR